MSHENVSLLKPRYGYLVRQHFADEFWQGEVDSTLILAGYEPGLKGADLSRAPIIVLSHDVTKEQALNAGRRCMLVKRILEIWSEGTDLQELKKGFQAIGMRPYAFPSHIGRKNHGFPIEEFAEMCKDLPERLNNEPVNIHTFAPVGGSDWYSYATRQIGEGCTDVLHKYALNQRDFLGPTTLTPELAFIMANLALADATKLVMDPYVGSGGALVGASHYGSKMIGMDIDWRIIHGGQPNKTFDQYNLARPDFFRGDFSAQGRCFREQDVCCQLFDAILGDPPYGIRAGARKVGAKEADKKPILPEHRASHIPQTQKYEGEEVIRDLMDAAATMLRFKGRLVYLHPVETSIWKEQKENCLPRHPKLQLLYAGAQHLKGGMSRVLVTMEKSPTRPNLTVNV